MAAKINDGLFIGDFDTSQDVEFLELNKISSLINLAGQQLPNIFASHGIVYMTMDWEDREDFELFPASGGIGVSEGIKEMALFIDKCQKHGTSVLLFSVNGTGRCAAAASCYLMYKYGWGFEKAYDFLFAKKPDLDLNRGFVEQLFKLDKELRKQKYKSLHNISDLENERLSGWNVDYLLAGLGEHPSPSALALVTEEVLMVNSFNNSKLTITTLPGPYESAMRQFKNFKLQFNLHRNQEAGIHLQRTHPKSPSFQPPRGGILKGGSTHCPPHLRSAASTSPSPSNSKSKPKKQQTSPSSYSTSNSRRVLEESSDEDEEALVGGDRRPRSKNSPTGKQEQDSKHVQHLSPQEQEDSLLFGGSISLLSSGKDTTDSLYDSNNHQAQQHSESLDEYYDRPFHPHESMQSQNSQGSDLYDFVGLQSKSGSKGSSQMDMVSVESSPQQRQQQQQPRRRESKDASSSRTGPGPAGGGVSQSSGGFQDRGRVRRTTGDAKPSQSSSSSSRGPGATPEERLHSLLGNLQRGGGGKKNPREDSRDNASYESGSKPRSDQGYRSDAKRSSGNGSGSGSRHGISTTVHDVANMNIQPAYYQNGMSVSGQPVVAKPLSTSTTAWGDNGATAAERNRVQSERRQKAAVGGSGSKQYRSNAAGNTYRHGSPAPQVSSGGLSGRVKQGNADVQQSQRSSSGGGGGLRRYGSAEVSRDKVGGAGSRNSTPSRASSRQKDVPVSRRHGTPSRERESTPSRDRDRATSTRDRHPTPTRERNPTPSRERGGGQRERDPTPTRQRAGTPDRARGWKY